MVRFEARLFVSEERQLEVYLAICFQTNQKKSNLKCFCATLKVFLRLLEVTQKR